MTEFLGCGAENASAVICRGRTKRTYSCAACVERYEGSGRPLPYRTDVEGQEKLEGTYYGPARTCGQEVEAQ